MKVGFDEIKIFCASTSMCETFKKICHFIEYEGCDFVINHAIFIYSSFPLSFLLFG